MKILMAPLVALGLNACSMQSESIEASDSNQNLYFIGQDLDALRGYYGSRCCAKADGTTAYLSLYNLLNEERNFGGLGVNGELEPIESETGWGAGPVSAWKTAKEFDSPRLAIGLAMTEADQEDGLDKILAGKYDAEIKHFAAFSKKVDIPILLRIAYEFDGTWNTGYENADRYQKVWHYIVDMIRSEGADKVQYVWQASTSPIDDIVERQHEDISKWYPGDEYVDWIGASWFVPIDAKPTTGYNDYDPPLARQLLDEVIAFARQHGKPVMIAELSPQGFDLSNNSSSQISYAWNGPAGDGKKELNPDQIWDQWFAPLFTYLEENDDVIDSISYINVRWDDQQMWGAPYGQGYWGDSRLEVNPVIANRWNEAITKWKSGGDK